MPPEDSPPLLRRAALARIEAMRGTVQVAQALVEAGRTIDLGGLDAEAARICVAIGIMPPQVAGPLRPALIELRADLDRLAAAFGPPEAA